MAVYQDLTVGVLRLTPMTVAQIGSIPNPANGTVAFCTNEGTSGRCLVSYDETAAGWIVVETGDSVSVSA